MTHVTIVAERLDGHRADYIRLFRSMIAAGGSTVDVAPPSTTLIGRPGPIVSLMLEEHSGSFARIAAARALLGRRSAALVFRAAEALDGTSARLRAKRLALRVARRTARINTVAIQPFALEPRFAEIVDFGIDDPQLWDLDADAGSHPAPLVDAAIDAAAGRALVVALGGQNRDKGFGRFAELWLASDALRERTLFVAAGRIDPALARAAIAMRDRGALVFDQRVEDADLLGFHARADAVWTCYAPDYDQASGIFGRSVQLGAPVIVRRGAAIARHAIRLDHPHVEVDWTGDAAAERLADAIGPMQRLASHRPEILAMRRRALDILGQAIGVPLAWPA